MRTPHLQDASRLQRGLWGLLLIGAVGVPLLVSHHTERTLWRVPLDPNTFILNTLKIELLPVDVALVAAWLGLLGLLVSAPAWRARFVAHTGEVLRGAGGLWWAALAAWGLLSVAWSVEPGLTLYRALHWAAALGMALAVSYVVRYGPARALAGAVLLAATLQGALALAQFLNDAPLGLTWLDELQTPPNAPFEDSDRLRAYGLAVHPNILASFLMLGVFFSGVWAIQGRGRWAAVLAGAVALLGIVATGSRVVLVLTLLGSVAAALLVARRHLSGPKLGAVLAGGLLAVLLAAGALQAAFPSTWERLTNLRDTEAVEDRVTFAFVNTVPIIEANPALGVGHGAAIVEIGRTWEGSEVLLLPAHNTYVHVWSELGAPGVVLFIAGLVAALGAVAWRGSAAILGMLLLCMMGVMLFDYYFWGEPRSQTLLLWVLGAVWGYALRAQP